MIDHPFTIKEVIKEGWRLTKENLGFLIGFQIIMYVTQFILTSDTVYSYLGTIGIILSYIISTIMMMGFYNSALMLTKGVKPGFDQLYACWSKFFSWLIASILWSIMALIGFILLIVPGCYVMGRFGLFPFSILDKDLGPIEALKQTSRASVGHVWKIFLLLLACIGLGILGILLFVVGILITSPIAIIAMAVAYRKLTAVQVPTAVQTPTV